ncbi:RxLR effector protein [Phytophthora megakarya]|uniref:RxLR effector protein n=1 Tax=Phytophthora megakarya TaxID=4795 RepID=A0A225WDT2_9STRA|nr:RxLR effector protein [Phytophthora megakarya]
MMRVCQYILLMFVILLASTVTAQANKAQFIQAKVTPAQHPYDSLMIHRNNDEERGVQVAVLSKLSNWATNMTLEKTAKNLKFRAWLKAKKTPAQVYTDLKFTGKAPAVVRADKNNYELWLEYSSILAKTGWSIYDLIVAPS